MVVTQDLDVSMSHFIQFTFQYGCSFDESTGWPREYTVLLQYSNNGGILWHLLKEVHFHSRGVARFFSVRIAMPAQTNSTRFRFWQPRHGGGWASRMALSLGKWWPPGTVNRGDTGSIPPTTVSKLRQFSLSRICRCLSEETLKADGPFYLVSMPGEVKDPTQGVNV